MDLTIRPIAIHEIQLFWPVFADLLKSDFPGYTKAVVDHLINFIYTPTMYQYWLESNQKIILGAFGDQPLKIIGFAVIDSPYGGVSFCRWLGVVRQHQRQGIGTRLINEWVIIAKKQGCHKVELTAQPEAREFYEKVGLQHEGKRIKSYFGIDLYLFGKVIGEPNDLAMTKKAEK